MPSHRGCGVQIPAPAPAGWPAGLGVTGHEAAAKEEVALQRLRRPCTSVRARRLRPHAVSGSSGNTPAGSTRCGNGGGGGDAAAAGGGGEIAAFSASNRGTRGGNGGSDGDGDCNCGGGGGVGGGGGGRSWCSRESEQLLLLRWSQAYSLHGCSCSAPEAAPSAPVASTAASGGRVVGLPPTSTGVSLDAWRFTRSRGPTELDDRRTLAGGKAVCWRKF